MGPLRPARRGGDPRPSPPRSKAQTNLLAASVGVLLVGASAVPHGRPELVWNASASVPVGLYRVTFPRSLGVGDLVVVRPPPALAGWLDRDGYLPRGVPLLKPVAALSGQRVCREGVRIVIDGTYVADARGQDRRGRPLPRWRGCLTLADGQVFLLNPRRADSLDGRYFGPLSLHTVIGRATPIWTGRAP